MADLEAFLRSCAGSGALLASLCALAIVPFVVWLTVRSISGLILSMDRDREWQAAFAGIAAILPGFSFVLIATYGLATAWHSNCLQYVSGRVIFAILLLLTLGAVVRAVLIARRRTRDVAPLKTTYGADNRLRRAAGAFTACELKTDVPLCAVVGMTKPRIVVSTAALSLLDDDQLESALRHEGAHIARCDHLIGPLAAFFSDLLPLSVTPLLDRYFESREFAADRHAAKDIDAAHLAGAIIALARMPKVPLAALRGGIVVQRLRELLSPDVSKPNLRTRIVAGVGIALAAAFGAFPVVAGLLGFFACRSMTG